MNQILIVGLGNPEPKHARNRHNLGFMVLDALQESWQLPPFQENSSYSGWLSNKTSPDSTILLLKPTTYMNESGKSVIQTAGYYHIAPANIWVIHDDMDIPFGNLKIQTGISAAGHNGIHSIIENLHTQDFWRFRCGISRPQPLDANADGRVDSREWAMAKYASADFVLEDFDPAQSGALPTFIETIKAAIENALNVGPERAAITVNQKPLG
jgi:peptidyl-tRNA hydrolase, PTH1 family